MKMTVKATQKDGQFGIGALVSGWNYDGQGSVRRPYFEFAWFATKEEANTHFAGLKRLLERGGHRVVLQRV